MWGWQNATIECAGRAGDQTAAEGTAEEVAEEVEWMLVGVGEWGNNFFFQGIPNQFGPGVNL